MRYVLFNWMNPADVGVWEAMTPEEQQAEIELHMAWFRRHRDHVVGGEELDEPRTVKTLRPGRQGEGAIVTDGPFVESKEILGGFVIIEAESMDDAVAIAADWPSLATMPNATVQVQPAVGRG
jgi:hypothetical protein